ncbi:MAG TPA: prepilin-type N-terminal cleavage/methylation domain-containing protein [Candidatus Paceibacterota bacterium]
MKKHKLSFDLSKGFTLVELLVVIAIIGVLATLLLLQLGVARGKARDTQRITNVSQLRNAMELYFDDNNGHYPAALNIANLGKYLTVAALPKDPVTAADYFYSYNPATNPTQFHLWSELEQKNGQAMTNDSDINSTGWSGNAIDASNATTTEACTAAYNAGAARDCIYDVGQK